MVSDAGGVGSSDHAERSAKNRRLRVHYLLEAEWDIGLEAPCAGGFIVTGRRTIYTHPGGYAEPGG